MTEFIPWNSQPLDVWAERYAEGSFVDLKGRQTHYVEEGEGKPVILVHGFNMDLNTWIKNIEPLAQHFKVYAPDLWGQGYSTRQPLDYGYDLFKEQIELFMEAKGIEKASIVGHSMGGGTSIVFALRNPERVDKMVLVDATGVPTVLPFRAKIFRLNGVAEFLLSLRTDRVRRMNLGDIWTTDQAALDGGFFDKFTLYQKVEGTTEAILTMLRLDFFDKLGKELDQLQSLRIPTMIVWGREDASLPVKNAEVFHQLIPTSRLEILDGAGHLANFDRSQEFNELLIEFLSD